MNLYVHFPFCRRKCAYCALLSRAGTSSATRTEYVAARCAEIPPRRFRTVYFGGGTPALCDLGPLLEAVKPRLAPGAEFTVELHPLDVTEDLLAQLHAGGVNRVSLGVQSFDDAVLAAMGRGHTAEQAEEAFGSIRGVFPNCGIDLIAGWPGGDWKTTLAGLRRLRPVHASVYTLIREERTRLDLDVRRGRMTLPSDAVALEELAAAEGVLREIGLERYEISNFAKPGFECRHNSAVWAGEDYTGLGEGACGREGRTRTRGVRGGYERETLTEEQDALERVLFALRTRRGLAPCRAGKNFPVLAARTEDWMMRLDRFAGEGALTRTEDEEGPTYRLTARGHEICDTILAELV